MLTDFNCVPRRHFLISSKYLLQKLSWTIIIPTFFLQKAMSNEFPCSQELDYVLCKCARQTSCCCDFGYEKAMGNVVNSINRSLSEQAQRLLIGCALCPVFVETTSCRGRGGWPGCSTRSCRNASVSGYLGNQRLLTWILTCSHGMFSDTLVCVCIHLSTCWKWERLYKSFAFHQ